MQQAIKRCLAEVLDDEEQRFANDAPFMSFGVDSLLAVAIVKQLNAQLAIQLRSTDLFNYASIRVLAEHILQRFPDAQAAETEAAPVVESAAAPKVELSPPSPPSPPSSQASVTTGTSATTGSPFDIAVIGMAGQFPDAPDIDSFWNNLTAGHDAISPAPAMRWNVDTHPDPVVRAYRWGGFLRDADLFDPLFFNISPMEAEYMDPQQRLFLQQAWKAFEQAGYAPDRLAEQRCGVFVGCSGGDYGQRAAPTGADAAFLFTGNIASILAGRIAYFLNLRGPSVAIDTACSSSLVALDAACRSLWTGGCEMALAGGVAVLSTPLFHLSTGAAGMLSPEGRCKTFDAGADGFVPGEAAAAIILKPLTAAERDGDAIYGVIKATGVNQDGRSNGITAPSAASQTALEVDIYRRFGIDPRGIQYIEAHGTGTQLGDPIEVSALTDAFREFTDDRQFCALGSVKSNIGHTLTAAGIAGVIKTLLCLNHGKLVPSLHYRRGNEHIALDDSPFYVNTELCDWPTESGQPRRAAVSSFGLSGTNAHVIVEAYRPPPEPDIPVQPRLIALSARDSERLRAYARALADWLTGDASETPNRRMLLQTLVDETAALLAVPASAIDPAAEFAEYGLDQIRLAALIERVGGYGAAIALTDCTTLNAVAAALPQPIGETEDEDGTLLARLAHTLQTGRAALDERLAIVASSRGELADKLAAFLAGEQVAGLHRGNARTATSEWLEDQAVSMPRLLASSDLDQVARLWCAGVVVDWNALYSEPRPRRLALPTYPFAQQRFWLAMPESSAVAPAPEPEATFAPVVPLRPEPEPEPEPEFEDTAFSDTERADMVESQIRAALAAVLKIASDEFDGERGFDEFGVNSILAVDIAQRLGAALGITLRATELFNYGTIHKLTDYINTHFAAEIAPPSVEQDDDAAVLALFRRLEQGELSADRVYRQLEGR